MKVSGRGESHCRSVGTELPGHDGNKEQVELEDNNLRKNHLEQLVHDVLSVDPLEDVSLLDDVVQVRLHELEHQVEVLVIRCSVDIQELDDVWVAPKLFQKDNFPAGESFFSGKVEISPECSLSVCSVAKGVKYFLHGNNG